MLGKRDSVVNTAREMTNREAHEEPPPLLIVDNVVKSFPLHTGLLRSRAAVHAVAGVSIDVHAGEVVGIVGESGSGKSTLARLMLGLIPTDRGHVLFDGIDVMTASRDRMKACRRGMQLVFQDPIGALDPRMRLGTSLGAPMAQHRMGTRAKRQDRVGELLELVGLDQSFADRFPSECSGGELQRVVIARALSLNPRLLICDEPTAALDASNRAQILNVLDELKQRLNLGLIMISHDLRLIALMSDRIAVMYLGLIVELADGEQAFTEPLHPYTRQLIEASQLDRSKFGRESGIVDGEPPSPVDPPKGCHFHPRCPLATDRCMTEVPELLEVRKGRWVACFRWDAAAADL